MRERLLSYDIIALVASHLHVTANRVLCCPALGFAGACHQLRDLAFEIPFFAYGVRTWFGAVFIASDHCLFSALLTVVSMLNIALFISHA